MTTEQVIKIDYTKYTSMPSSKSTKTIEVEAKYQTTKPVKLKMKLYKASSRKTSSVIKKNQQADSDIRTIGFTG